MGELMVNPGAIKKNTQDIGDLSNLTTTEKSSLVGAVNELDSDVGTLNTKIATQSVTITPGTGINISSDSFGFTMGGITVLSIIADTTQSISANATIATINTSVNRFGQAIAYNRTDNSSNNYVYKSANSMEIKTLGTISTQKSIRFVMIF